MTERSAGRCAQRGTSGATRHGAERRQGRLMRRGSSSGFQISDSRFQNQKLSDPLESNSEAEGGLRRRRRRIRSPAVAVSWVAGLGIASGGAGRDALLCRGQSGFRFSRPRYVAAGHVGNRWRVPWPLLSFLKWSNPLERDSCGMEQCPDLIGTLWNGASSGATFRCRVFGALSRRTCGTGTAQGL